MGFLVVKEGWGTDQRKRWKQRGTGEGKRDEAVMAAMKAIGSIVIQGDPPGR